MSESLLSEDERQLLRAWNVRTEKLCNVIRALRPNQADYVDFEEFDKAAEQWNDALRAQGIEPNDLA